MRYRPDSSADKCAKNRIFRMSMPFTKKANLRFIFYIPMLFLLAGCTYFHDRARDFGDIFTVSAETKHLGVSAQIFPASFGVAYGKGKGYGLRSGTFGVYSYSDKHLLISGEKDFYPLEKRGKKKYDLEYFYTLIPDGPPWQYYWQIEVAAGLGVGLRLGLNLGEMADFMLGWAMIDIANDDTKGARGVVKSGL